jgi:halocyanin-like protein
MTDFERRTVLKAGGAALTIGLAGCLADGRGVPGRAESPEEEEDGTGDGTGGDGTGDGSTTPEQPGMQTQIDNHLSDTSNYDTVQDYTGQGSVEVINGDVEGTEQPFAFGPAAIQVDSGAEVTWTWSGGTGHSVTHTNGSMFDSGVQTGDGTTFSQTFDEEGLYLYHCIPHRSLGQKGAIVVGSMGGGSDGGSGDGSSDGSSDGGTGSGGGETKTVEMRTESGNYLFDPIGLYVEEGDTVVFENVSGSHSATAYSDGNGPATTTRIPEGAEAFNSQILAEEGATYEVTFDTAGTYDYFCIPHKALEMVGRIVVGEPGGPAEGSMPPDGDVPDSQTIVDQGSVSYDDFTG